MAEIIIITVTGAAYVYNTNSDAQAEIIKEIENKDYFLCRPIKGRRRVLVLKNGVSEFVQQTMKEYLTEKAEEFP